MGVHSLQWGANIKFLNWPSHRVCNLFCFGFVCLLPFSLFSVVWFGLLVENLYCSFRLSNVEELTRATMKKLTQGMAEHNKAMAAAKSDEAKEGIVSLFSIGCGLWWSFYLFIFLKFDL